jgi:DNA-directed RNA polymerase subunit RPC12/RpoP
MATAEREITCPMCGFKNPESVERCRSCGAKVEEISAGYSAEEAHERRHQQDHFELKWALLASGVYLAAQLVILVGLPFVISSFDPQGLPGLLISVAVWFVGGVVVGVVSPGKTFVEPAVGALIAVIPTVSYLAITTPDGFQPTLLAYIVTALLGVMIALFGAFLGEKLQMSQRPSKPVRST